jgi:5-methylcytosine-specific restriction endonuclease McrA
VPETTRTCPWCSAELINRQRATCGAANCVRLQRNMKSLRAYYLRKAGGERRYCQRSGCEKEIIRTGKQQAWPRYCTPWCRAVAHADVRDARPKPPPRRRACLHCQTTLPPEAPSYRKYCSSRCGERHRRGLVHDALRKCAQCGAGIAPAVDLLIKYCSRPCRNRAAYLRNTDAIRARTVAWKLQNEQHVRQWHADYRNSHRRVITMMNRRDYKADPLPWKNARDRRRLLVRGDPRTRQITLRHWQRLLDSYRNACAYCSSKSELTVDHVIPLARGGRHAIGNIVPACRSCNSRKSARFVMEWRLGKSYRRKRRAAA